MFPARAIAEEHCDWAADAGLSRHGEIKATIILYEMTGSVVMTAAELGITPNGVRRRLQKVGISLPTRSRRKVWSTSDITAERARA